MRGCFLHPEPGKGKRGNDYLPGKHVPELPGVKEFSYIFKVKQMVRQIAGLLLFFAVSLIYHFTIHAIYRFLIAPIGTAEKQEIKVGAGLELTDGRVLQIHDSATGFLARGTGVTLEGRPIPEATLTLRRSDTKCIIRNSKIEKILAKQQYQTRQGSITIEKEVDEPPGIGDLALQNGKPAPDGKYRLAFLYHVVVKNGQIVRTQSI